MMEFDLSYQTLITLKDLSNSKKENEQDSERINKRLQNEKKKKPLKKLYSGLEFKENVFGFSF